VPTLNLIKKLKIEIMTETKQKDEKVFANGSDMERFNALYLLL